MVNKHRQSGRTRVLVVDDQPVALSILTQVLRREGYAVATATDGAEALRIARTYPAKIHLLFSDVEMPGMSGIELAKQIVADRPEIRVLLASGSPMPSDAVSPFLPKPFRIEELLQKIRVVLGSDRRRKSVRRNSTPSILAFLSAAAITGVATWLWFRKTDNVAPPQIQPARPTRPIGRVGTA